MRRRVAYVQLTLTLIALTVVVVLTLRHPQAHVGPVVLVCILLLCSAALSIVKLRYFRDGRNETRPDHR